MALSTTLASLKTAPAKKGVVQTWLDTLEESDKNIVIQYMLDESISSRSMLRALREEGAPFGKDAFQEYRNDIKRLVG